jgi:hypothetical protein
VPKRLDPYYQTNITRRDLVILREEKQQSNGRNIVVTITLSPSFLPSPKPLESEIFAKHLDHKPKVLDLPNLTEPEPNT